MVKNIYPQIELIITIKCPSEDDAEGKLLF